MRIAIISAMGGAPWGGSEELWASFANEAIKVGHELAALLYPWPKLADPVQTLQKQGTKLFFRRPEESRWHSRLRRVLFLPRREPCWSRLKAWRPDIVLISEGSSLEFLHDPFLREFVNRIECPYFIVNHFVEDIGVLADERRKIASKYYQEASRLFLVSQANWRILERKLAFKFVNAEVVRNPVNLLDHTILPYPSEKKIRFACVARLDSRKMQEVLFEAFSGFQWKTRDWELSLFGAGASRNYLEALAVHYGIREKIQFLGHTGDIRKLWESHHCLVLSSHGEGTPLALVEAMLCGRVSIVTRVGGNAEWVQEANNGFLAEAPTAHSFSCALEKAWDRRKDWAEMGKNAHETAISLFDPTAGRTFLNRILAITQNNSSTDLSHKELLSATGS